MSEAAMEAALDCIVQVRIFLGIGITCLLFVRFLHAFIPDERTIWLAPLAYMALMAVMFFLPQEMPSAAAQGIGFAGAAVTWIALTHGRRLLRTVYLITTFFALRAIAFSIGRAVHRVLYEALFARLLTPNEVRVAAYAFCALIFIGTATALLWVGSDLVCRALAKGRAELEGRECLLLIAPSVVALVADIVIQNLRLYVTDYLHHGIQVEWNACVLEGTVFLSILATTALFSRVRAAQSEKTRHELLNGQLADLRSYIGTVEDLYDQMRSFRHDMANHLQTLEALEKEGDRQEAADYARSGMAELMKTLPAVHSGNPVTDVILSRLQHDAEAEGIRVQLDFHWPDVSGLDAFDIGVVLHNAGSNALRAARESTDPFVCVRSILHRRTFVIEVRNSCLVCPVMDAQTALPVRSSGAGNGIGLMNVRSVADKYGGIVKAECADRIFVLTVLLPPAHNQK